MKREEILSETVIQVPFHDLDPMEVVWHGNYIKYFEVAREQLLDEIGYGYPEMKKSGYAWPVIDLKVRYMKPSLFGMKLRIRTKIDEIENRLKISYLILNEEDGTRLCKGHTVQVAVNMHKQQMCLFSPQALLGLFE